MRVWSSRCTTGDFTSMHPYTLHILPLATLSPPSQSLPSSPLPILVAPQINIMASPNSLYPPGGYGHHRAVRRLPGSTHTPNPLPPDPPLATTTPPLPQPRPPNPPPSPSVTNPQTSSQPPQILAHLPQPSSFWGFPAFRLHLHLPSPSCGTLH